jgi:hypothetical protein
VATAYTPPTATSAPKRSVVATMGLRRRENFTVDLSGEREWSYLRM